MTGHDCAKHGGGRFALRIEDLDQGRSRPEFVDGMIDILNRIPEPRTVALEPERIESMVDAVRNVLMARSGRAVIITAPPDIAREVARRGAHAWDRRVVVSKPAKLGWVAKAGWQAAIRDKLWHDDPPRTGL